jgi:hypothetical protein
VVQDGLRQTGQPRGGCCALHDCRDEHADSEQYERYKAAPATIAAGGGRFIARDGKLAVPDADADDPGYRPTPNLNDANQAAVPNSSDAQQLLMRDGGLLDQTTRSCCAKAPASTIWPRLPCRDRGGGPMSAQPTAANGAMGAISATTPRTVALLLLVPCPLWCAVALHLRRPRAGLPADRGTAVWVVPVHRHVPGVPAFRQRVKT